MIDETMLKIAEAEVERLDAELKKTPTGEIPPFVRAKDIEITGTVPAKTLASYLSRSKRFDNVQGFGGFGLVEWNGRRCPPAAGTAAMPTNDPERSATHINGQLPLDSKGVDVDSYNDAHPDAEPIQIVFDFTMDLAELEAADEAA